MTIMTERLILRPFRATDAADVYEYLREPAVHCFFDMRLENMKAAEEAVAGRVDDPYYLAVTLKDTGKVIGEIFGEPECTDPTREDRDTFSPCWMLSPAYQGKGYAFEAVRAYIDRLFREEGIRRVYAYTEDYNLACQRLCEKLGMRKEGEFKEFVSFINDENGDPIYETTLQYAILKKEWCVSGDGSH